MKTNRRILLSLSMGMALWLAASAAGAADRFWLVTPEEARQDRERALTSTPPYQYKAAINTSAPELTLLKPDVKELNQTLKAPFPIQLSFKAKSGATVVPESFKALYGMFNMDVTERILKHAKVTPEGIKVEHADIPSGSHKLLLRVSDNQSRQGEIEFRFTVE